MSSGSPDVVLFDGYSNALAVQNGVAIPTSTPALMIAGSDGTNSRYILIDGSSRQIVAGAGVAGTPTGGVLSIQGVSGGTVVPISGTVTSNQGVAAILSAAWPVEVTDGTNILGTVLHPLQVNIDGYVQTNPNIIVANFPTIQPVSGTVAVTQSTSPWSSNITQFGGTNIVTGTGTSGSGIPRITISNDSNILATQSGTWTVQQGTPPWTIQGDAATGAAVAGNPVLIGGSDGINARSMLTDTSGRQVIVGAAAAGASVAGNPIQMGGKDPSGNVQPIALAAEQSQYVSTAVNRQVVHSGATITASGSIILSSYGNKEITLFINIKSAPTGTSPTLTYTIQEVDPGDLTTILGTTTTGAAISAVGTQILTLSVTKSGVIKVSWAITGASASFTGVYATLVTKLPGVMIGVDSSGVQHPLLTDSSGNLKTNVAPQGGGAIAFGDVTLSTNNTTAAVRRTTYTEQTTNFTGSIVSSSTNDKTGGTGAITVIITYLDQTGAGPNTETVTLNGTTAVNLVNTNHCFIENIIVVTVGSSGANVGTITFFTGSGGTGTNVGSIGALDNRTFWAHHYTPSGKTSYITGSLIANTSSTVGAGATYAIKAISIGVAGDVEKQVTDTLTLYGQSSMTPRLYTTAIPLAVGPARLTMYVSTLSATTQTYRGSFDYYDQ